MQTSDFNLYFTNEHRPFKRRRWFRHSELRHSELRHSELRHSELRHGELRHGWLRRDRVPMWLKIVYSLFTAVMSFTYFISYGATNFLYFCDQAVLLTFAGIWLEDPLLISLCTVGILGPQALWVVDFIATILGHPMTGMTGYMLDTKRSLFLRAVSSFHGWLPFLLIYLVRRLGYDRRALPIWTAMATATLLVCFFFMPRPRPDAGLLPVNINYVRGLSDSVAQNWVPPWVWLMGLIVGLPVLLYAPTHWLLSRFMPAAGKAGGAGRRQTFCHPA